MVSKTKRGLTLIEVAISILVLGVVSTTVVEVIHWSAATTPGGRAETMRLGDRERHS